MKQLLFLGTGSSTGVPIITCECHVCKSDDLRDKRSRVSLLLESSTTSVVIDISPDFRSQAISNNLQRLDAILITHSHNDHIAGLDDVRIFNFRQKSTIPLYSSPDFLSDIGNRFRYIFTETQAGGGKPDLKLTQTEFFETFRIGDFAFTPIPLMHGSLEINGFIIDEQTAYLTDVSRIPEKTKERIRGIKRIILGAVRDRSHPTHFSFDEAAKELDNLKPEEGWFIHMTHDLNHRDLENRFYPVKIPYDGLQINLDD